MGIASRFNPNLAAFAVVAAAAAYLVWQTSKAGRTVSDGLQKWSEAITFDPDSLGPGVELTDSAADAEAEYIRLGYLERLPDGGTRITKKGAQYVLNQQTAEQAPSYGEATFTNFPMAPSWMEGT